MGLCFATSPPLISVFCKKINGRCKYFRFSCGLVWLRSSSVCVYLRFETLVIKLCCLCCYVVIFLLLFLSRFNSYFFAIPPIKVFSSLYICAEFLLDVSLLLFLFSTFTLSSSSLCKRKGETNKETA